MLSLHLANPCATRLGFFRSRSTPAPAHLTLLLLLLLLMLLLLLLLLPLCSYCSVSLAAPAAPAAAASAAAPAAAAVLHEGGHASALESKCWRGWRSAGKW